MTERERLIELIRQGMKKHEVTIENYVIPTSDYLADYLLENGVVVLPCKVGDTVYWIDKDCLMCNHFKEYCSCDRDPEGSLFDVDYDKDCKYSISEKPFNYALLNYIGKTVFLTKEEAEKALEEDVKRQIMKL